MNLQKFSSSNLTDQQLEQFQQDGFILLENVLTPEEIDGAQKAYWRIYRKCVSGEYVHFRHMSQLSDIHIYGIEYIFHPKIFEEAIFSAALASGVLPRSQQILGTDDTFMALNRIQCTQHLSYSGFWHRDGDPCQLYHVQSGIFFYPETRFFVIPGSHRREDTTLEKKVLTENRWRGNLPGQVRLKAPAGSMMLFHSSIIHRASCVGRFPYNRAYLHFRIAHMNVARKLSRATHEDVNRPEVLNLCDDAWKKLLTRDDVPSPISPSSVIYRNPVDRSFQERIKKAIAWAGYYGLSWLPESSNFFAENRRFVPYLWPEKGYEY